MKVLKWFRYGFLSLGFLCLFLFYIINNIPIFFSIDDNIIIYFGGCSFIIYSIIRIIELCKSEKKIKPIILTYVGHIIAYLFIFYNSELGNLKKSLGLSPKITLWLYWIIGTSLILTGVIYTLVYACKNLRYENQKLKFLSSVFLSVSSSFLLLSIFLFFFGLSEPVSYIYNYIVNPIFWTLLITFLCGLFASFVAGILLKLIYLLEKKEKIKKTEK